MRNRRRIHRWQISWRAKIKLEGAQNFANCTISDISFKGARLTLPLKLPRDTFLKSVLVLSKDLCLNIELWVIWHKTIDGFNTYGLYFSLINEEGKEKIRLFLRQNFRQQLNHQWYRDIKKEGGEIMREEKFEDHRIFERFKAGFPLNFIDLKENREGEGTMQDVSAKGIGFSSRRDLLPLTPLEMWLKIPDKAEPLYTRGEVVWSKMEEPNNFRVGVNLEKADLMGLSRVLRLT